jgi:hypothetical protein
MANASAGRTAKAEKPATPTWHELAAVTDAKRRLWLRSRSRTGWPVCGREWDVVVVEPMAAGLEALAAMRAGTRRGYQVLADHLSDRLYVAVPADSGDTFEDIPRVRVLPAGTSCSPEYAAERHDRGRLGQPPARRQTADARAPKPSRPGPGRPAGPKNRRPATRHDVGRVLATGEAYSRPAHHKKGTKPRRTVTELPDQTPKGE